MERGADVEAIVDLMESELGPSSRKQDSSARAKFNTFLKKHVDTNLTMETLRAAQVTKEMLGKLLTFLFNDPDIHWQTSMNYLSSIKRQLEEKTGTDLFSSDPEWYRRCRRHLQKQYLMLAISEGKKLKNQAPPMTIDDLRSISTILFLKYDKKALLDRTLLNNQWLAVGRSSDVGMLHFTDLHWHGSFLLIDLTRIKGQQQQTISIFCSPICWSIDPFHALASQLVADPYNASPRVFSQVTEATTDERVAIYINRVLKSVYQYDTKRELTQSLQSHSARRGGAAHASSNASVNLADLAHRGLWSMDGFATLLEYISPTTASGQNVAKVLGGWADTKQAGHPPTLAATLLMYYRDTLAVAPQHIVHQELERVHSSLHSQLECQDELLDWGSKIRKRFVTDNILSLPIQHVRDSLTIQEQAEQFVGFHTFAETLERLLIGYQQLVTSNEELRCMLHLVLRRLDRQPEGNASSTNATEGSPDAEVSGGLSLRSPQLGKAWPTSLTKLKGRHLSDVLVQFYTEGLGSIPKERGNRGQKDCLRAVKIVAYVADLASIPPVPALSREVDRVQWVSV